MTERSEQIHLQLPLEQSKLASLSSGQKVLLTGEMYTMRDAGHKRCMDYLNEHGKLPYDLAGQTLYYAGPTPPLNGQPFGAIGPTTSSRMDAFTPALMDAGIVATVGKGKRNSSVTDACIRNNGLYLATVGGIAALLARCVKSAELIAWEDLGTEALQRIEVVDMPAYVAIDTYGDTLYK